VRRLPHENYLIFYRVDENQVVILHVLNGAQDYKTLLLLDDES
jgi:plasmid stabilization system protein ParE